YLPRHNAWHGRLARYIRPDPADQLAGFQLEIRTRPDGGSAESDGRVLKGDDRGVGRKIRKRADGRGRTFQSAYRQLTTRRRLLERLEQELELDSLPALECLGAHRHRLGNTHDGNVVLLGHRLELLCQARHSLGVVDQELDAVILDLVLERGDVAR